MSCYPLQVVSRMVMNRSGEVFYIGGNDVLPAPLEPKREAFILQKLGTGQEEEAKSVLIEHNLRLVVYIAKKFDNTGVGVEDLISIGTIGLIKAINTFNPVKNIKLATYASRCIENEILMYLRRNSKTKMEVSIDEPLNVDWDGNELLLSDILGTDEVWKMKWRFRCYQRQLESFHRVSRRSSALDLVWERRMLQRKHRKRLQTFWEFLNHIFPGWKKES